ncbi:MAG TPA: thioredoxin domain-containing protein [Candidatus Sulfotelmatobacter sp.]|nr:thioredoxin domain-containing protein [Candidatus Sulfotelmatobacter sp.]
MTSDTLNSLASASSAYLRSAMHQPIHWHEWGPEAFAAAQRDNKPMLLDIGAVWCHWCHVMDRESYDDPEIAAIVNQHFIAVKVDRDERPDIDSRYQAAVQAVSGQGGWPLTAFLTPDGKPFYGGTYFPPSDGYGRPSFRRVLLSIANAYAEKHGDVVEQAKMVESAIAQSESFAGKDGRVSASVIAAIQTSAFRMFDPQHGGFGQAPKFPHPSALDLLIERYARKSKSPLLAQNDAREMGHPSDSRQRDEPLHNLIVTTLEHMANGGVYDQLAGGFHRYSVDERWVVPHFEKMCYDNSELLKNYVHAYQATGEQFFADVARDIIRWMDEWLSDRERGGFYASQDADINMDDDGDYFTWTLDEARAVLTEDEAQVAALHYDINEVGEMHHNAAKNVLYVRASVEEIARRMNRTTEAVAELLMSAKKKLYAARLQRTTPYIDKTVYVGWNSLCISAYLEAAKVLSLADARRFALRSLDRVLGQAWKHSSARLLHVVSYSDPAAAHREVSGLLEDYAFTALACLDAYEATADLSYFKFAHEIMDAMISRFYDATSGGFFDSEPAAEGQSLGVLATRRKPLQDSPTPAGNPMAAIALTRLHHYTGDAGYRDKAEQTLETFAGVADQFGIFTATYGIAVAHLLESPLQIVVIAEDEDAKTANELHAAAVELFSFGKTVLRLATNQAVPKNLTPALAATIPSLPALGSGKSFAVLCSGSTCQPPIFDAAELHKAVQAALQKSS